MNPSPLIIMPMPPKVATGLMALLLLSASSLAAGNGLLKLEVPGGDNAKPAADVYAPDGRKIAEVLAGHSISLNPGVYRLVLPIIGGKIVRDSVKIEAGRTHTVLISGVAVLKVGVRDRDGKDPGFGVTVTGTTPPHMKLIEFVSGDSYLMTPNEVDVKVDAPPQGYYWHAVKLPPGRRANLELSEMVPAELRVEPQLANHSLDRKTRVVVYKAGTQTQVAQSEPGPLHRFKLDPGNYDVYVENQSGAGRPYVIDSGIRLKGGDSVERKILLDTAPH